MEVSNVTDAWLDLQQHTKALHTTIYPQHQYNKMNTWIYVCVQYYNISVRWKGRLEKDPGNQDSDSAGTLRLMKNMLHNCIFDLWNDEKLFVIKLHTSEGCSCPWYGCLVVNWRHPSMADPKDLAIPNNTSYSSCPTGTKLLSNVCESGVNDKVEGTRQIALQAVVVIRYSGHGTTRCHVFLRGKSNTRFVLPCIPTPLTFITPIL